MSFERETIRGFFLNARSAVNGIQNASRSFGWEKVVMGVAALDLDMSLLPRQA